MSSANQIIAKSYRTTLIIKCGLLFAAGLLLTGIFLYFSARQPLGPSYQESFARLAQLKHEMLIKSIIIYCLIMILTIGGVIFITVLYSHRVVGPLVGLTRIIKAISTGDFTMEAHMREKDAIISMADALNDMRTVCRNNLRNINNRVEELQVILQNPDSSKNISEIIQKAREIQYNLNRQ